MGHDRPRGAREARSIRRSPDLDPVDEKEQPLTLRCHLGSPNSEGVDEFCGRVHNSEGTDRDSRTATDADCTRIDTA